MPTVRLFTGIDLPAGAVATIEETIDLLRPHARLRWSKAANLHVTTKFIGEWPQARLAELTAVLAGVEKPGPIPIEIKGLGWLPNPHQPRIFWALVHAPRSLYNLAAATDASCAGLGIASESKPYTPHLTLARIGSRGGPAPDLAALRRAVASLPVTSLTTFEALQFHLYLSEQRDGGSCYTKLESFNLI
jgi:2'-5' RNA ligase